MTLYVNGPFETGAMVIKDLHDVVPTVAVPCLLV